MRRLCFRYYARVPIVAVQSIAMPCGVSVCKCIGVSCVYRCREKKRIFRSVMSERRRTLPFSSRDVKSHPTGRGTRSERWKRSPIDQGHAPITNRSSGSIRNDYCWLHERGVCTRPALGIYIETNPISHYVRSFKFTSKFSVYACDIKVYLHTT